MRKILPAAAFALLALLGGMPLRGQAPTPTRTPTPTPTIAPTITPTPTPTPSAAPVTIQITGLPRAIPDAGSLTQANSSFVVPSPVPRTFAVDYTVSHPRLAQLQISLVSTYRIESSPSSMFDLQLEDVLFDLRNVTDANGLTLTQFHGLALLAPRLLQTRTYFNGSTMPPTDPQFEPVFPTGSFNFVVRDSAIGDTGTLDGLVLTANPRFAGSAAPPSLALNIGNPPSQASTFAYDALKEITATAQVSPANTQPFGIAEVKITVTGDPDTGDNRQSALVTARGSQTAITARLAFAAPLAPGLYQVLGTTTDTAGAVTQRVRSLSINRNFGIDGFSNLNVSAAVPGQPTTFSGNALLRNDRGSASRALRLTIADVPTLVSLAGGRCIFKNAPANPPPVPAAVTSNPIAVPAIGNAQQAIIAISGSIRTPLVRSTVEAVRFSAFAILEEFDGTTWRVVDKVLISDWGDLAPFVDCNVFSGPGGGIIAPVGGPPGLGGLVNANLAAMAINGPSTVFPATTNTYAALGSFETSGVTSQATVAPNWTAPPFAISSSGVLTIPAGTAPTNITVSASYASGGVTRTASFPVSVTTAPPPRLINISTRARVETGDNVVIGGFVIGGTGTQRLLVRSLGPSLTAFGVTGALADPILSLFNSQGVAIATNDSWKSTQQAEIMAANLAPGDDRECAIIADLAPGAYTAIVRGVSNSSGVAIVEVYDLGNTPARLINLSTRARVQTGDNVVIGGLVIGGTTPKKVIIRAIGPTLANFGVNGALLDPTISLRNAQGVEIAANDNWKSSQQAEIMASGFPPTNDLESAIVITLPPGPYTAIVSGVGGTSGVALVEVYELP